MVFALLWRDSHSVFCTRFVVMFVSDSRTPIVLRFKPVILVLAAVLTACGGGGGAGNADSGGYGSGTTNAEPSLSVDSSVQVDENQNSVTTVTASDADGDNLSFTLSGADADAFSISSDGTITFVAAPDFESKASYSITVTVSDGTATASQDVSIEVLDLDEAAPNSGPVFVGLEASIEVNENQTSLLTVEATDADDDTIAFSLQGTDAASFAISDSGIITFLSAPDYETQQAYEITVVASDGTDQTTQILSIQIVDVAEDVSESPVEFNLVVARGTNGFGTGNKYSINDNISPNLNLETGKTYRLLQSDSSNATHPVYFSTSSNGSHGGGTEFTEGVSRVGSAGNSGAYVQITVPEGVTTLYYYCLNHAGMGGTISISSSASGFYVVPMN